MSKGLALADAAALTPEAERAGLADRRERLLLYVGLTRARDLLVLAARYSEEKGASVAAIGLLAGEGGEVLLEAPFDAEPGVGSLGVGEETWPCLVRQVSGLPPVAAAASREATRWYAAAPRAARPHEKLNPSADPLGGEARIVKVEKLGGRKPLDAKPEQAGLVGDAIHGFLATDRFGAREERVAMATRILTAFKVVGAVSRETLLSASDALKAWLDACYPGAVWHREWPIRARLEGEHPPLVVGEVDLFLELPDGFVLVDHKSFPGGEKERDRKLVEEYAPQLGWYAKALERALGKPKKGAFIHLLVRGAMVGVGHGGTQPGDPLR